MNVKCVMPLNVKLLAGEEEQKRHRCGLLFWAPFGYIVEGKKKIVRRGKIKNVNGSFVSADCKLRHSTYHLDILSSSSCLFSQAAAASVPRSTRPTKPFDMVNSDKTARRPASLIFRLFQLTKHWELKESALFHADFLVL